MNGLQIDDINQDSYSDYTQPALLNDAVELELRELYLQGEIDGTMPIRLPPKATICGLISLSRVKSVVGSIPKGIAVILHLVRLGANRIGMDGTFLTVGKQQIVWGKSDGLKVLDIVNPQSFREFILDDFESARIPLWTLNIERSIAQWELQFLWIPDQTYHALPEQNARYGFTSPELVPSAPAGQQVNLEQVQRPNYVFLDSDVGLRATTFWKGWDITFNYLYQYNNLPVLRQKLSLSDGNPVVTITPATPGLFSSNALNLLQKYLKSAREAF